MHGLVTMQAGGWALWACVCSALMFDVRLPVSQPVGGCKAWGAQCAVDCSAARALRGAAAAPALLLSPPYMPCPAPPPPGRPPPPCSFNVYVSQPEVKPGCVLRRANFNVLERRGLVDDQQVQVGGRVGGAALACCPPVDCFGACLRSTHPALPPRCCPNHPPTHPPTHPLLPAALPRRPASAT